MPALGSVIAARQGDPGDDVVDPAIFGTADPDAIAAAVDAFCVRVLGASVRRYRFFISSIASVHGVVLSDGRDVVVKAHQPPVSPAFLGTVCRIQQALSREGFPAPAVVAGPHRLGRGHATVEARLEGRRHDGHDPAYRGAMAATLAELVARCRTFLPRFRHRGRSLHVLRRGTLWPTPHSRLFDFEATARGAAWIDAIARRALAQLEDARGAGEMVLAHGDWRAGNLRFDARRRRISAVYDWESLGRGREPAHVGAIAHAFCADWERDEPKAPDLDEIRSFVAEYEEARGEPFTVRERRSLAASLTYATAYTARCGHAIDPARREFEPGDHRHLLREHGRALLAI
jgi:Ser/Thr protein kinase RdoA (MazF antagonist)